jgi:hypothetical protein
VKTYATWIGGVLGAWLAYDVADDTDVGDSDSAPERYSEAQLAAIEQAAAAEGARDALVNGPATSVRYQITGTFVSRAPVASVNGDWYPSITFGGASAGFAGGDIASSTAAPAAPGQPPQQLQGGSWVQIDEHEIQIRDTVGIYVGTARVEGGSLVIRGLMVSGGTIQVINLDAEAKP